MMVASIFVYYFSTDSHVKVLSCKNNYYLSDSEVYDLANVSTKTRIYLMPSIILEKRVEKMPFVQSCDVSKKNRNLNITLRQKSKGTYYVKARSYIKIGKKYYYGPWSKVKKVTLR